MSHINLLNGQAHHESLVAQLVRAPNRCLGGHRFDSRRELKIFSLSHARVIVEKDHLQEFTAWSTIARILLMTMLKTKAFCCHTVKSFGVLQFVLNCHTSLPLLYLTVTVFCVSSSPPSHLTLFVQIVTALMFRRYILVAMPGIKRFFFSLRAAVKFSAFKLASFPIFLSI